MTIGNGNGKGNNDGRRRETDDFQKGVKHLVENGVSKLPNKYILPVSDRPNVQEEHPRVAKANLRLPVIDFAELQGPNRSRVLDSLASACEEYGVFQVVNHGIPIEAIRRMIDVSSRFFDLPFEEREKYISSDRTSPVRYGTSLNQIKDSVFCWRDFLNQFHEGSQLLVLNCFPPCPEPNLTLGMPPHSDYGFLTLLLQDEVEGLQIQYEGRWITVEPMADSFVVNVGDHLEIFSNGKYKSVLHRVFVNPEKPRLSVASLHSLQFNCMVGPSPKLIDEENPSAIKIQILPLFLNTFHLVSPRRRISWSLGK